MIPAPGSIVDVHCHVGLLGDTWPEWGFLGPRFLASPAYPIFLAYARVEEHEVSDPVLRERTEALLAGTAVDHVIALALDMTHDERGVAEPSRTSMYVANEYVLDLQRTVGGKVLLGASVHPYRSDFETRVRSLVDRGAVLLKWLPSAQGIDLASPLTGAALRALATLGPTGGPLPLLLHTGAEYAVPPAADDTPSLDFYSWSRWDALWNFFRVHRWRRPDVAGIEANLRAAVGEGAVIIFSHCGMPYLAPRGLGTWAEHSDFDAVARYLRETTSRVPGPGRFLADVSACCTPFRQGYFGKIMALPPESLLFGSDYPTPVFELSAGIDEAWEHFRRVAAGDLTALVVPDGNLLDVNLRELSLAFPEHPMFTNFARYWHALAAPLPDSL